MTDRDKSAGYWGLVGQDPRVPELKSDDPQVRAKVIAQVSQISPLWPAEQAGMDSAERSARQAAAADIIQRLGFIVRHSGTGEYAGVLVALLALFALANSCRGPNTPFSPTERRAVWFWAAAALFSVLAAWGRFGLLYSFLYRLPYFSTIRNPIKFLHPFHIIWIILAGYGLEVLHRRYLRNTLKRTAFLPEHIKLWWSRAAGFEKKWVASCALVLAVCLAGWVALFSLQSRLGVHIAGLGFKMPAAMNMAASSVWEAAWFIGFLVLSVGVLAGILSGAWNWFPRQNGLDLPRCHFYSRSRPRRPALDTLLRLSKKILLQCRRGFSLRQKALRATRHGPLVPPARRQRQRRQVWPRLQFLDAE